MVIAAGAAKDDHPHPHPNNHPLAPTPGDFMAAMVPQRSNGPSSGSRLRLPNFSSLPCFNVQWGRRVHLRCIKDVAGGDHDEGDDSTRTSSLHRRSPVVRSDFNNSQRKRRSTDDGGIEAMTEKLMLDFRAQVTQMQAAFLNKSDVVVSPTVPPPPVERRPCNLRTRRAVCRDPNGVPISSDRKPGYSAAKPSEVKSPARSNAGKVKVGGDDGGERPREKFSISLSKQEIEEDFLAILGTRPARRPKKRPRNIQKKIDSVFPGFWLSEITPDMYKVNEQQHT